MTERLSDITARIDGIRQLGVVVNAAASLQHVPSKPAVSLPPSIAMQRRSRLPSGEPSHCSLLSAPLQRVDRADQLWWYLVPNRGLPAPSASACSMRSARTFPIQNCSWSAREVVRLLSKEA